MEDISSTNADLTVDLNWFYKLYIVVFYLPVIFLCS